MLTETKDGSWQALAVPQAAIEATVKATAASQHEGIPVTFCPHDDRYSSTFTAAAPESLASIGKFIVVVPNITLGDQLLEFEFKASTDVTPQIETSCSRTPHQRLQT